MLKYLNFDLRIEDRSAELRNVQLEIGLKEDYRIKAVSQTGEASAILRLPFSKDSLAGLLSQLRQLRLGTAAVQDFGATLFRSAFSGEVLSLFRASQNAAHEREVKLRIRLQIRPPELAELPWEYLFDPEQHQFLAISIESPILRFLPLPERKPLKIRHPLRVLVTLSSPEGFPVLELEKEWTNLLQALSGNQRVKLIRLERPTLDILLSTLRREDFHIFHFIGHGQFDSQSREGSLVLEREDGKGHLVPGWALGEALHDERTLRLAVINACEGASFGGADPFAGVAQAIVQKGLPAVIAMQTLIMDATAVTFARVFYSALADGYPVDAALTEARKLIFAQGNPVEWGAPVLFLRSQDGQILDIDLKGEQPSEAPAPPLASPAQAPAAMPESAAARSSSEPRLWLAIDTPPRTDWEEAFRRHRLVWNSRGASSQKHLSEIAAKDWILAYRSLGDYLFGLVEVADSPVKSGKNETAIPIATGMRFERGISLDEMREALPDSGLVSRGRPSPLAPVCPEDWAVLRALILHHNPVLAADALPPSTVPPQVRGGIEEVQLLDSLAPEGVLGASDVVQVSVQVRNRGNVVWANGESWSLTCRWWPKNRPGSTPARQWDWGLTLYGDVAPGGRLDLSNSFKLPDEPGLYRAEWTLAGRDESEPATKIETVVVNLFRPLVDRIRPHLQKSKLSPRDLAGRGIERETLNKVMGYEVEDEHTLLTVASQLGIPRSEPSLASEEPQPTPPELAPAAETEAAAPPSQVARDASAPPPLREQMPGTAPPLPVSPPTESQVLPVPGVLSPSLPGEPAQAELTRIVEVDADRVTLRCGDRTYRSRLRLDAERLVAAASPREYGEALFDALFNPEGLDGFDSSTLAGYNWVSAQPGGGRRIEIELRTLELQDRKWEYLADSRDRSELPLAAVQSQPFYRRWGNAKNALAVARPLRILAAIASPATLGREVDERGKKVNPRVAALSPIDVAQERDVLETGLQRLAGFAEYHVLDVPVTLKALREALQDGYHVLHLLAHGLLVEGSHYLVLEGDEPPHHLVTAEAFCNTLQGSSLRLVVLAACQSAVPDAARSLRGLGASLLDAVPAVIAMQDEIRVDTAQLFTQHFYDRLARTGRVDQAMARTRAALYQEGGGRQWQWGVPVLLMSTGDGRLFDVDEARVARELPRLEPQVKSYQELAGAGDPTVGKWERAFGAAARAYDLPLTVLPAPPAVPVHTPAAPAVEPEILTRPQDRAELLALARIDLDADELGQEVAGECRLDLPSGVYSQIASALNAGKHVILIGPPGTGKTSLAHAVCNFASRKGFATGAALTTATADWTAFDTVGGYVPTLQQTLQFRAGVFLEAIRTGRWLVIDEINRAEIDKAFGELFTVLAGQQVDLPYAVGPYRVRVLPPAGSDPESWLPTGLLSGYDYVIHPNWRIVATMNVYDKSHLFTLSFAFMRRFAFIDVELPGKETYDKLIDGWLAASGMPPEQADPVREVLGKLLTPDNPLTSCRELGPAIVKDMIAYMSHRHHEKLPPLDLMAEALLLYVTPQLDGIDSERIVGVRRFLVELVGGAKAGEGLLRRVRSLYPHVPPEAWT